MTTVESAKPAAMPDRSGATTRRTDLDVLRVLICGCVIFAHAMLIFAVEPRYHLKSELASPSATVGYEFMRITTMAIFFVLAGWAALGSVRRRGARRFMSERASRLLAPLGAGVIVFGSVIKYIELRHGRDLGLTGFHLVPPLQDNFFEFLPTYLTDWSLLTWSHLWFLAYLYLISLLLLPLLTHLGGYAARTAVPAAPIVYLPALILAAHLVAFDGYWPFAPMLYHDGANFFFFAWCFAIGAGIAVWPGFDLRLQSEAPRLLIVMLIAFGGVIYFGESTAGRVLVGITAWAAIGAALGYAARFRPQPTAWLLYLSEASLAVYILHHMPLLVVGALVLPLAWPVWVKIAVITLSGAAIGLAAFHWLFRPYSRMRRLVGMSGQPPASYRLNQASGG